jgi:hypothetical protein
MTPKVLCYCLLTIHVLYMGAEVSEKPSISIFGADYYSRQYYTMMEARSSVAG